MFIILIIAYLIFYLIRFDYHKNSLRAMIDSGVFFSALTVFCAELLSIFSAYRPAYVFCFWLIVIALCFFAFRPCILRSSSGIYQSLKLTLSENRYVKKADLKRHNKNRKKPAHWLFPDQGAKKSRKKNQAKSSFRWLECSALLVISLFCIGTLATALIYPPTNYDSHVYHLPRVFFWFKNASVHNYPTNVARQLYVGPFNSIAMLQMFVLSHGSDLCYNVSQWFSYVGSIVVSALIAAELGLSRRWQTVSALFAATIPLSILQAVTTQNDLTVAFWCAVTVYYVLRLINDGRLEQWLDAGILTGLSLGIAVLTKQTAFVALAPFAVMIVCLKLRKLYLKNFARTVGVVLSCALMICAGFFIRNAIDLNGDFLALKNAELTGTGVLALPFNQWVSVIAKNLMYNLGNNSPSLSALVYNITNSITEALGVGINAPGTFVSIYEFQAHHIPYSHDTYPNPFHSLLVLLSFLVIAVYGIINIRKSKDNKSISNIQMIYTGTCIASFLITAAGVLFNTSISRYLLPSLLLAIPICAVAFSSMKFTRLITYPALMLAVWLGMGPLFFNSAQPLVADPVLASKYYNVYLYPQVLNASRTEILDSLLMTEPPHFADEAKEIIIENGISRIGIGGINLAIYPVLNRFWDASFDVAYFGATYHNEDFTPQAIICVRAINDTSPIELNDRTYVPAISYIVPDVYQYVLLLDEEFGYNGNGISGN